jgi:hypothetical protein
MLCDTFGALCFPPYISGENPDALLPAPVFEVPTITHCPGKEVSHALQTSTASDNSRITGGVDRKDTVWTTLRNVVAASIEISMRIC